jgi:hypothetical protein
LGRDDRTAAKLSCIFLQRLHKLAIVSRLRFVPGLMTRPHAAHKTRKYPRFSAIRNTSVSGGSLDLPTSISVGFENDALPQKYFSSCLGSLGSKYSERKPVL